VRETIVLPSGEEVDAAPVLLDSYAQVTNGQARGVPVEVERRVP
jgi:hypothetical protein